MKEAWTKWKALSKRIGRFQARILFSILYFVAITPVGIFKRGDNYLKIGIKPVWEKYDELPTSLEEMKEQ